MRLPCLATLSRTFAPPLLAAGRFAVGTRAIATLAAVTLAGAGVAQARDLPPPDLSQPHSVQSSMVLDGRFVHNVGELQVNITNWGLIGSFPGAALDMSDAPSAQWPAASGVEYLYAGGIWVAGKVWGIPHVSTAYPDRELLPGPRATDTVYRSFAGAPGSLRSPAFGVDDDGDGAVDEDPLNGLDDDGDGSVDEDFAATSDQMFRCVYRDDYEESLIVSPDHHPLGVEIVQESYQWENDRVDDFVGLEYTVINVGRELLTGVYLGFYADPDVASRSASRGYLDDVVDHLDMLACYDRRPYSLPIPLMMGIAYDKDGDEHTDTPAPGHFGVMLLGYETDGTWATAPGLVYLLSWNSFAGNAPFSEGGEPVNDDQRYLLMSTPGVDEVTDREADYRMLLSTGPFLLAPGDSAVVRFALVAGEGREGLLENATQARLAYDGVWYDLDQNENTGVDCKETMLYNPDEGIVWFDPCNPFADPLILGKGEKAWVNADCLWEARVNATCFNLLYWCTGENGRESPVGWLSNSPPPPPNLRIWPAEGQNVLFWDDFSEHVPDALDRVYDFEGYRIWRADNWLRPPGTSAANGPPKDLWMVLDEFDIANEFGHDTGFGALRYHPNVDANLVAWYSERLLADPDIETALDHLPPSGYAIAEADTAIILARYQLGMPGGKVYYSYADPRVRLGMPYFYSVTAFDHELRYDGEGHVIGYGPGLIGDPANGFAFSIPQSASQPAWDYDENEVYVVPNPATRESMAPWTLFPNNEDPTGLKVEFRHLPAALCRIRIYTLAGDLVQTLTHDARSANQTGNYASTGTLAWNLTTRNGQDVASGVYLFALEAEGFPKKVGRFTVIR